MKRNCQRGGLCPPDYGSVARKPPGANVSMLDTAAARWQGSLLEFRGPVCQQSDGSGFGVVSGLDYEGFSVRADVEADRREVW
jgi:hypothetical protein